MVDSTKDKPGFTALQTYFPDLTPTTQGELPWYAFTPTAPSDALLAVLHRYLDGHAPGIKPGTVKIADKLCIPTAIAEHPQVVDALHNISTQEQFSAALQAAHSPLPPAKPLPPAPEPAALPEAEDVLKLLREVTGVPWKKTSLEGRPYYATDTPLKEPEKAQAAIKRYINPDEDKLGNLFYKQHRLYIAPSLITHANMGHLREAKKELHAVFQPFVPDKNHGEEMSRY